MVATRMRGRQEGMGGGGRRSGRGGSRPLHAHAHTHVHTHTLACTCPSIIISQDTGKASGSRHEAQERTPGGAGERGEELERGKPHSRAPSSYGCRQAGRGRGRGRAGLCGY